MPLTSFQKHYIKKNIKTLSPEQIYYALNLPREEINRYIKKHWPKFVIEECAKKEVETKARGLPIFNFSRFTIDNIGIFILLFLLVFISYVNSLGNGFVSDDIAIILKNENIGKFSSMLYFVGFFQNMILFLIHKIGGDTPYLYRLVNIFFHLGSTFLFFAIINLLSKRNLAIFASVLFAVHPIFIESVAWISGMPYSMYGFFFLISFLFYILKDNRPKYLYLSILFFFFSLLSNEKAVALFLIFIIYELSFENIRKSWKRIIPYFSLSFLWLIMFIFMGKFGGRISALEIQSYQDSSGLYNPFIQIPIAITSYLKLIFWPDKLTLYHTEMTFTTGQYIICLLVFLIYLAIVFISWKKNRSVFFWLSFFFITLLPTLTPLKIAWIVAERYVYLGSLGIFVVIAVIFNWLLEKTKFKDKKYKYAIYSVFIIITLSLSIRTIIRNMDWQNENTLWIATGKTSPSGPNTHNNLGDVYSRQGDKERAAEEFKKAIELNPNYADAYHNMGNTYIELGKKQEAIEAFQKAIGINPNLWESYQNLSTIYFEQGDYQKSYNFIKKALEINPRDETLKENLALIQAKLNQ